MRNAVIGDSHSCAIGLRPTGGGRPPASASVPGQGEELYDRKYDEGGELNRVVSTDIATPTHRDVPRARLVAVGRPERLTRPS